MFLYLETMMENHFVKLKGYLLQFESFIVRVGRANKVARRRSFFANFYGPARTLNQQASYALCSGECLDGWMDGWMVKKAY